MARIAIVLFLIFFSVSTAFALSIDQAKQQGLVGEQLDGYIGAVKPSSEVNKLVAEINRERRAKYQAISEKNGTTLQNVEILAGKKAVENSAPGSYIKAPNGAWLKK